MKHEALAKLATDLVVLAREAGCRGIIVALSSEEGGHSEWTVRAGGPCIELEGLATHIPPTLVGLWPESRHEEKD